MAMEQRSQSLTETCDVVSNGVEANQTSSPLGNQTGRLCSRPANEIQYRKGPWKSDEDVILQNYVKTHGEGLWNKIPERTDLLRSGKSCRLRWKNHLSSEVNKAPLTPEEEDMIIQLQSQYGNRWSIISSHLPGRTDNNVKNFWNLKDSKLRKRRRCSVAPPAPLIPVDSTLNPFGNNIIPSMASTSSSMVGTNIPHYGMSMAVTNPSLMPRTSNHYSMCQNVGGSFEVPFPSFSSIPPDHPPFINAAGLSSSFNASQSNPNAITGYNGPVMTEPASNQLADAPKDDLDVDLILNSIDLDEISQILDDLDPIPVDGSIENIEERPRSNPEPEPAVYDWKRMTSTYQYHQQK